MDYYANCMLGELHINNTLTVVEIPSDIAAGFVGCTGYIDQITPRDFSSRKADVLRGKDQHGRPFISMLVLETSLQASTVLELVRGGVLSAEAQRDLAWAAKPRVLTLFQRYQDRDDLFVTAGDRSLGSPKDCPMEFYEILQGYGGRYKRLTQAVLGAPDEEIAVPKRPVLAVASHHLDGTIGVMGG